MFNNMKNKIREKTGNDIPKFTLGQIQQKLGRHSRQGSETSLSSVALDEEGPNPVPSPPETVPEDPTPSSPPISPLRPDNNELTLIDGKSLSPKDLARLAKREDEWRARLEKRDSEWNKKIQKRENELMKLLDDKEREWRKQEQTLTEDLLRLTRELKDALKVTEEYKKKMVQYQEDKDQLEHFQTQELTKIKHLLLAKEQENTDNASRLKEATALVENLKQEVNRLRPFEEQVSNYESTTKSENIDLKDKVLDAEKRCLENQEKIDKLLEEMDAERESSKLTDNSSTNESLVNLEEFNYIKDQLHDMKSKADALEETLKAKQKQKDEAQLRNAQISQEIEFAHQKLRTQTKESEELYKKLNKQLEEKDQEIKKLKESTKENQTKSSGLDKELEAKVNDLEFQLNDKNKMVRVLQQRLNDLKKTLQKELKVSDTGGGGGEPNNLINPNGSGSNHNNNSHIASGSNGNGKIEINYNATSSKKSNILDDDVNFKYLKHVLIKFLTCREYEAQHLTRAVATLLKFTPEEERLLRETVDWKMSWFGSRPRLHKTIRDS